MDIVGRGAWGLLGELQKRGIRGAIATAAMATAITLSGCGAEQENAALPAAEPTGIVEQALEETAAPTRVQVASIPERGIVLYGLDNGVELRVGDRVYAYDWPYTTPRQIPPVMRVGDYDADGTEELMVDLYVGSGTGVSVEELHIVEIGEEPAKDYRFIEADYSRQIGEAVGFKLGDRDGEPVGELTVGGDTYAIDLNAYPTEEYGRIGEDLVYGSIVGFEESDGKMTATFGIGLSSENFVMPAYIGKLHADVSYKDGTFALSNYKFAEEVS